MTELVRWQISGTLPKSANIECGVWRSGNAHYEVHISTHGIDLYVHPHQAEQLRDRLDMILEEIVMRRNRKYPRITGASND